MLPAITLAIPTGAMIAQVLAKSLRTTLREPYIDTARAKGASTSRVQLRHALRNASLPALTMAGIIVGSLLSGSVVVETVFSRTGLGRLTSSAVSAQDIPVVQGLVVFAAVVFVSINLLVDLLYPVLDPRIVGPAGPPPLRSAGCGCVCGGCGVSVELAPLGALDAAPALPTDGGAGAASIGRRSAGVFAAAFRRPGLALAAVWVALVGIAAIAPALLTSRSPLATETSVKLQSPSMEHWFGTDQLGRDLYTRVVYGAQVSLQAAVLAVAVGLVVGGAIGLVAGFARGWSTTC